MGIFLCISKNIPLQSVYLYVLEQSSFSGDREEVMLKLGHAYRQNAQSAENADQQHTQYEKAIEIYRTALTEFPNSPNLPKIQLELAKTYFQTGNYAQANQLFDEIYKKEKKTSFGADALYWFGQTYLRLGEFKKAKETYEELLKRYPESELRGKALIGIASTFYYSEDYTRAIEHYSQLLQQLTDEELLKEVTYKMVWAYRRMGEYQEAARMLSRLENETFSASEASVQERFQEAETVFLTKDFQTALALFADFLQDFAQHDPGR